MENAEIIKELYRAKIADNSSDAIEDDYLKFTKQVGNGLENNIIDITGLNSSYNVLSVLSIIMRQRSNIVGFKLFGNLFRDISMPKIQQIICTNPTITSLDIGCNDISDESYKQIIKIVKHSSINSLQLGRKERILSANRFSRDSMEKILEKIIKKKTIKCLGLSGIGSTKAKKTSKYLAYSSYIADVIAKTPISTLDLSDCGFEPTDLQPLANGFMKNKTLRILSIKNNSFMNCTQLINGITNILSLRSLNLSRAGVTSESIDVFTEAFLRGWQLIFLDISDNNIGTDGISALLNVLQYNQHLITLNISQTNCESGIAQSLGSMLEQNEILQDLDLSKNTIGDTAAFIIGEKLKYIRKLYLNTCRISDKGALAITNRIATNDSIQALQMRDNFITRDAGYQILELLQQNESLTRIDLSSNKIDFFAISAIQTLCTRNKKTSVDRILKMQRKDYINLSIDNAKIPDVEERLAAVRAERNRIDDEMEQLEMEIERQISNFDLKLLDAQKGVQEIEGFIKEDTRATADTKIKIAELEEQHKNDLAELDFKCRVTQDEYNRLEGDAVKNQKVVDDMRAAMQEEQAKLTEEAEKIEAMIEDIQKAMRHRTTLKDYEIPENPFKKEKEEKDNAKKELAAADDSYFEALKSEISNDEEGKKKKKRRRKRSKTSGRSSPSKKAPTSILSILPNSVSNEEKTQSEDKMEESLPPTSIDESVVYTTEEPSTTE